MRRAALENQGRWMNSALQKTFASQGFGNPQKITPGNSHDCLGSKEVRSMSSGQVIRAAQQFTKKGRAHEVNLVKELVIGLSLGLAAGATWKVIYLVDLLQEDKVVEGECGGR